MEFLTGKDYPELCPKCRAAIDSVVDLVAEGADTDDPEAPCDFVYDHRMFCGGHECVDGMVELPDSAFFEGGFYTKMEVSALAEKWRDNSQAMRIINGG